MSDVSVRYAWFDTEYTHLELETAYLLQVALIVTDAALVPLEPEGYRAFVRVPSGEEGTIGAWVREQIPHVVEGSETRGLSIEDVDRGLAAYLDQVAGPAAESIGARPILAGNSVHADWFLARKFLPLFQGRLHYRLLDVSTLKTEWQAHFEGETFNKDQPESIRLYYPAARLPEGVGQHDAAYDIQASIAELAYYRSQLRRSAD